MNNGGEGDSERLYPVAPAQILKWTLKTRDCHTNDK